MKQHYIFFSVLFFLGFALSAQTLDTEYIPTSEVPEAIIAKQEFLFPSKYVEGWQAISDEISGPELYISKFKENTETGFSATYTSDGVLVYHSKFLPEASLPETAVLKIRSEYDRYEIQSGYLITIPTPKQEIYRIDILDGIRLQYLYYTVNGQQIPEESLPIEIRLFEK